MSSIPGFEEPCPVSLAPSLIQKPDVHIRGAAHRSVTAVIYEIQQMRRNVGDHPEVKELLDDLELLSNNAKSKISLLTGIIETTTGHCPFFDSIVQKTRDACNNYSKIREEIESRNTTMKHIRQSDLARRLSSILTKLKSCDDILNTIGIITNLCTKPFERGVSTAVAGMERNLNDARGLEYLDMDCGTRKDEDTAIRVRDPAPEMSSLVSSGHQYYDEGFSLNERGLVPETPGLPSYFWRLSTKGYGKLYFT